MNDVRKLELKLLCADAAETVSYKMERVVIRAFERITALYPDESPHLVATTIGTQIMSETIKVISSLTGEDIGPEMLKFVDVLRERLIRGKENRQ